MVPMTMAQHDQINGVEVDFRKRGVMQEKIRGPGVEEDFAVGFDKGAKSVLGQKNLVLVAHLGLVFAQDGDFDMVVHRQTAC
ncbi:hypothetical protein DESC_590009 [Desulfosarcina cetonica]|nr:hypothetical protein DESC_590009 [Desulfosarcina cetonica]